MNTSVPLHILRSLRAVGVLLLVAQRVVARPERPFGSNPQNIGSTLQVNGMKSTATRAQKSEETAKKRIIGGHDAPRGRYEYIVSLQAESGKHTCGGTLIAPDIVLSAAHCYGSFTRVSIGLHNFSIDRSYEIYSVTTDIPHPKYQYSEDNTDVSYDFLLIKLSQPVAKFDPVRLNRKKSIPQKKGDPLVVMGWGTIDTDGTIMSPHLQEVVLKYLPNDTCKTSRGWIDGVLYSYASFVQDSMLCAWDEGKDACVGDSGGPIIVSGDDAATDVQVGVVSYGVGCASPDFPGIYSRLSDQMEWIDKWVCNLSINPPAEFGCPSVIEAPTIPESRPVERLVPVAAPYTLSRVLVPLSAAIAGAMVGISLATIIRKRANILNPKQTYTDLDLDISEKSGEDSTSPF